MTDNCKARKVVWDDLGDCADGAFSVFVPQVGLEWAEKAWEIVTKAGLSSYSTGIERYTVLFRFLVMGGIYRDFCDAALEEHSYLVYGDWAEPLDLEPGLIFQMAGKDPEWEIDEGADVYNTLPFLIEKHRDEVYQTLLDGFGGVNGLFESLWLITHMPEEDDDEDEDVNQNDAFWPLTQDRACAYSWVSEGCQLYR